MLAIVDYGMGNLRSLRNALEYLGIDVEIVSNASRLGDCDRAILPGVGAFGKAMQNIAAAGFEPVLRAHVDAKKPLLGICLGMQLLADASLEFGTNRGLGLVPGDVIPFPPSAEFPVPHVGWNTIAVSRRHPFLESIRKIVDYYFVHSYYFQVASSEHCVATTEYGRPFASVVANGSVVGCQFHPEKSQAGGLALLESFANWDGVS